MEEPWAKRLRTRSEAAASGGAAAAGAAAATLAEKRSLASITIARGRRCPFRVLRMHAREARVSQYRKKNKKPMERGGQEAFSSFGVASSSSREPIVIETMQNGALRDRA